MASYNLVSPYLSLKQITPEYLIVHFQLSNIVSHLFKLESGIWILWHQRALSILVTLMLFEYNPIGSMIRMIILFILCSLRHQGT